MGTFIVAQMEWFQLNSQERRKAIMLITLCEYLHGKVKQQERLS
jgi:hypothetical protein